MDITFPSVRPVLMREPIFGILVLKPRTPLHTCRITTTPIRLSRSMISDMEPASFTIEFPVHVPAVKRRDWLDRLGTFGASVEQLAPEVFKVVCADAHVVDKIGWALLRTSLSKYCRVVSTSGGVEARASAYPIRSRKQDRRPRPY